jgi:hypothetical protein
MTTILQCDLKRTLTINEKTKTYLISSTDASGTSGAADGGSGGVSPMPSNPQPDAQPRGGVVNVTNTITDTGERKEMFGFTARRIKTSMVKTASPDACAKDQKVETDGWYIDFQYDFDCPGQTQKHQTIPVRPQPGCKDEIRTKTIGTAKLGFPLLVTTTLHQADGRTTTTTQEVLELSREPLSAALFEAPEGYALAQSMQELYGMSTSASAASVPNKPSQSTSTANSTTSVSPTSNSANVAGSTTAKKPGVVRIGLIMPKVQMASGNATQAAEAVRNGFAGYLNGPGIELVTLAARLPSLAIEEARQAQCDYVLSVSMNVKKGGGNSMFGSAIGRIAGSAASHVPGGGSATTGAARSAAITGIYTTTAIASSIKAKDEVSLEYKLDSTDGAKQGVSNTVKAKASRDGEDVVTGLVERAAGEVVATANKKQ